MTAARTTVLLLLVLMAASALGVQTPRVKRDKGGHHHQDVGRRHGANTAGQYRYGSHVIVARPTGMDFFRRQLHFRHPTRRPDPHKRMVSQRRPINHQLSHAPIGPASYAQQQRPSYLPVPVPIHLQPASVVLPSPPQSYQQPAVSSYQPSYQQQQQPQQYQQAPAAYQPPPPPPPPQQPQYQQYQPSPPPPAPYQPPAQYQPPPPPPPQQPEYQQQAAPEQYAPAPQQPEYQQAAPEQYAPQPAPQQDYQQSAPSEQYAPPPVAQGYQQQQSVAQQYSAQAPSEPLLPLPLYVRQQLKAPAPEINYAPVQENSAASYETSQQEQFGGYAPSQPVTIPPVAESYSSGAVSSEPVDQDIQTNAISSGLVAPPPVPGAAPSSSLSGNASQWTQGSIPWTLEKLGMNTLNDLLVLSGLDEMFDKEGPFTVFVPVDQAFEILIQRFGGMEKATEEFNKNPDVLESLLKHHVVPGAVPSSALQNNAVLQSLLRTPLRVKFYESEDHEWRPLKVITVNGARVVKPDIQATNGVIHIVDRVIFPVPQADIYNTLKTDPQQRYTTLVSAIDKAGLASVLANPTGGPYTVFAPTNKAFSLISPAELNGILNNPAKLTKLLQRHVVQDLVYTSGLQGFQKAYALDFEILYIYHAKGMTKVNGANVIDQDATALNGVIHTIDSVLGLY